MEKSKQVQMEIVKKYKGLWFVVLNVVVFSIILLGPNYRNYPFSSLNDLLLIIGHFGVSTLGLFVLVSLMSINRYFFLVSFPLFVTISSVTAYFTWQIDASINAALIESLLLTDAYEVGSYLTGSLVFFVSLSLMLAFISANLRFRVSFGRRDTVLLMLVLTFCAGAFYLTNKIRRNTLIARSPFSYYTAIKEYCDDRNELFSERIMLGNGSYLKQDSLIVVLVIGEALRADHLQLNGYHRQTMPAMERRGVVSFPHVFTPYTHTAASIPYMLTRADSKNKKPIYEESSFVDIFKRCGFHTAWIGNQNPTTSFKFFVNECDTVLINKPQFSDYSNTKKLDSDLIGPVEDLVCKANERQLMVIHLAGNHWWYNKNLPDDYVFYTPILENKTVSESNKERMINSYDNVTRFTDAVLDGFMSCIYKRNAILIFLSDHGQSFGEGGKWLHANDMPAEQNPACLVWFSKSYEDRFPFKIAALRANYEKEIDASFLFHSIVDAAGISSGAIDLSYSVFSDQFRP